MIEATFQYGRDITLHRNKRFNNFWMGDLSYRHIGQCFRFGELIRSMRPAAPPMQRAEVWIGSGMEQRVDLAVGGRAPTANRIHPQEGAGLPCHSPRMAGSDGWVVLPVVI